MASSKHKKRLLKELAQNPAFRVEAGGAWLCPYCGEAVTRERKPGEEDEAFALARAARHLERCPDWREWDGRPLALPDLQARAAAVRARDSVRRALVENPAWQLYDVARRWHCPFCAKPTAAAVPEAGRVSTAAQREIERHLAACEGYARGRGVEKPLPYLKTMVAFANRTRKMAEQIRRKIETDAAWRLRDADGRWVCLYCRKVQDQIDFSAPLQMTETAPLEIAKHLSARCEHFQGARGAATSSVSLEIARLGAAPTGDLVELSGSPPVAVSGEFPAVVAPHGARRSGERPTIERGRPMLPGLDASASSSSESGVSESTEISASESHISNDDDGLPRLAPVEGGPLDPEPAPLRDAYGARPPGAPPPRAASLPTSPAPRAPTPAPRRPAKSESRRDAIDAKLHALRSLADPSKTAPSERAPESPGAIALPDVEGVELRSFFRGAHAFPLDFVDATFLDDGRRLAIAVGGVSGEGTDTGAVLPMVRNLFRMHAKKGRPPGDVMRKVNADLFADLDRTFVSVVYGILDVKHLTYRFARAGANAPVLFNGARKPEFQLLETPGMVLGIDRGPVFEQSIEEREVRLEADDLVVQFTHGTVSAENVDAAEIGLERLHDLVRRYGRHEADYFATKVATFFEDWTRGAPLKEDACLLAFKIKS